MMIQVKNTDGNIVFINPNKVNTLRVLTLHQGRDTVVIEMDSGSEVWVSDEASLDHIGQILRAE